MQSMVVNASLFAYRLHTAIRRKNTLLVRSLLLDQSRLLNADGQRYLFHQPWLVRAVQADTSMEVLEVLLTMDRRININNAAFT